MFQVVQAAPTAACGPQVRNKNGLDGSGGGASISGVRRRNGPQQGLRSPAAKRPLSAPVALQGWLHKQGSEGLMLWKKRWFVLSEYCLFYYKGSYHLPPSFITSLSLFPITLTFLLNVNIEMPCRQSDMSTKKKRSFPFYPSPVLSTTSFTCTFSLFIAFGNSAAFEAFKVTRMDETFESSPLNTFALLFLENLNVRSQVERKKWTWGNVLASSERESSREAFNNADRCRAYALFSTHRALASDHLPSYHTERCFTDATTLTQVPISSSFLSRKERKKCYFTLLVP